jgi:hypothetical protein
VLFFCCFFVVLISVSPFYFAFCSDICFSKYTLKRSQKYTVAPVFFVGQQSAYNTRVVQILASADVTFGRGSTLSSSAAGTSSSSGALTVRPLLFLFLIFFCLLLVTRIFFSFGRCLISQRALAFLFASLSLVCLFCFLSPSHSHVARHAAATLGAPRANLPTTTRSKRLQRVRAATVAAAAVYWEKFICGVLNRDGKILRELRHNNNSLALRLPTPIPAIPKPRETKRAALWKLLCCDFR